MSFAACEDKPSLTGGELSAVYSGTKPGLLPSTPNPSSERDSNNMLSAAAINTIMNGLTAVIPNASIDNVQKYKADVLEFMANVNTEFCFYETRYKAALQQLFSAIRNAYLTTNTSTTQDVKNRLTIVQTLNTKLNDLTLIAKAVVDKIMSRSDTLQIEVNAFNEQIQTQRQKLQKQNKIIMNGEADIKIRKEMVKFTEEKARNSDNLLKLYSFLNIVVLGLLVYVYKAASE